ncbi:uncharacterized protein [Lolium perenne]|uniref:uncharacterized protein n=1 Tax=Lolium perenne TaxID=4522 RepID=UPI003A994C96
MCMEDSSSSDDDEELYVMASVVAQQEQERLNAPRHRGSVPGHLVINRERAEGCIRLHRDYFAEDTGYPARLFRQRFRMHRPLFLHIAGAVEHHDRWFKQKKNNAGVLGLHPLQKITAVFRMLAYGISADATDDYCRLGKSTTLKSLRRFVRAVIEIFGDEYLRSPNADDTSRLLAIGEQRGFPAEGEAPEVYYSINGHNYTMGYYLADGIYPEWATFVKTIPNPMVQKKKEFAQAQEGARKDIERAFGVLQARFAIVRGPARFWDQETLGDIMTACVIMHNMIIENERHTHEDYNYEHMGERVTISHQHSASFSQFLQVHRDIRDSQVHSQLQADLVEHQWQIRGNV